MGGKKGIWLVKMLQLCPKVFQKKDQLNENEYGVEFGNGVFAQL